MTDLLTDLTNATEGSRDLSDRVLLALDWSYAGPAKDHPFRDPSGRVIGSITSLPNPTVNLQDAVDLVARGWWLTIEDMRRGKDGKYCHAKLTRDADIAGRDLDDWESLEIEARNYLNPACAVCAAVLQAREEDART